VVPETEATVSELVSTGNEKSVGDLIRGYDNGQNIST
jgi:hypothetical protein